MTPQSAMTSATQPTAIEHMPVASLRPYLGNARTHSKKQIRQIADGIRQFGFTNPVLVGENGEIIAGHGRSRPQSCSGWRKSRPCAWLI